MRRIIDIVGNLLICLGILSLLSVLVQYIVFPDMPPTITALIISFVLFILGLSIKIVRKKFLHI